jgi:hypothetical protein
MNEHSEISQQRNPSEASHPSEISHVRSETPGAKVSHLRSEDDDGAQVRNEAEPSQQVSQGEVSQHVSHAPSFRETVPVGEAAKLLGVSVSTMQRWCDAYEAHPEANPPAGPSFEWTLPNSGRVDTYGAPIKGRRRVHRDAALAYGKANGFPRDGGTLAERAARIRQSGVDIAAIDHDLIRLRRKEGDVAALSRRLNAAITEMERAIRAHD